MVNAEVPKSDFAVAGGGGVEWGLAGGKGGGGGLERVGHVRGARKTAFCQELRWPAATGR